MSLLINTQGRTGGYIGGTRGVSHAPLQTTRVIVTPAPRASMDAEGIAKRALNAYLAKHHQTKCVVKHHEAGRLSWRGDFTMKIRDQWTVRKEVLEDAGHECDASYARRTAERYRVLAQGYYLDAYKAREVARKHASKAVHYREA